MFRKIHENDKNLFLELAKEFYASDAVMKSIPLEYHKRTFEEIMRSDAYLMCYIIECDGKSAGFALLNKTYQHEAGGCILWLEEFYVRKEFRSKGLGKDFIHYLDGLLEQDINWKMCIRDRAGTDRFVLYLCGTKPHPFENWKGVPK